MTTYLYPMDDTGCGSYRFYWPAEALIDAEPDLADRIKIVPAGDHGGIQAHIVQGRIKDITVPDDCETVVLQRPSSELMLQMIPLMQRGGIKVVVEIDDDLEALSARHPSWPLLRMPGHNPKVMRLACRVADLVTATTEALLERYAPHGRAALIPNCLPKRFLELELKSPEPEDKSVGWPGSINTHPDDLAVLGTAPRRVEVPWHIVGPLSDRGKQLLGVEPSFTGSVPFREWLPAISTLHTAVAPLALTRFNEAKSALKPLELAAARVPFACSPTPEYSRLGAGLIVRGNKPNEWVKALKRLLNEPGLREHEIGRNLEIARKWVIEDHIDAWRQAWFL